MVYSLLNQSNIISPKIFLNAINDINNKNSQIKVI